MKNCPCAPLILCITLAAAQAAPWSWRSTQRGHAFLHKHADVHTSFSTLLLRAAQHHQGNGGKSRVGLRMAAQKVARALMNETDDQAFAAIDAIEAMMGMAKPPGLMGAINRMRCEVCWARPKILKHKKCLKFLSGLCKKGQPGDCDDVCNKFKALLAKSCFDEKLSDKESWCDLHEYVFGHRPVQEVKEEEKGEEEVVETDDGVPDTDGDGVPDPDDAFPKDKTEQVDSDGDGIGDVKDGDLDGDGYPQGAVPSPSPAAKDKFPHDKKEWADADGDGTGDNADKDDDNDSHPDSEDRFPHDPTEWEDKNNNTIGDNSEKNKDTDGDGVMDSEDAFPEDPKETKDSDGDGVGDNADDDDDNDGHKDKDDKFPNDPKEWGDIDGDGIGDSADKDRDGDGCDNGSDKFPDDPKKCEGKSGDRDGDGFADGVDAFPDDPKEWLDSDGDGHGDNSDAYPNNPDCYSKSEPCTDEDADVKFKGHYVDPAKLNKLETGLPSQGYDEHSKKLVEHDDGKTFAGDWQGEWPENNDETMQQSIKEICKKNPTNVWCNKKKRVAKFAR